MLQSLITAKELDNLKSIPNNKPTSDSESDLPELAVNLFTRCRLVEPLALFRPLCAMHSIDAVCCA